MLPEVVRAVIESGHSRQQDDLGKGMTAQLGMLRSQASQGLLDQASTV